MRSSRGVFAIACTEDPVPLTGIVLHPEIVAYRDHLRISRPPLAINPFGTVCAPHAPSYAAPGEGHRWMIRQEGHGFDRLGLRKEARWTWPVACPRRAGFG